MTDQLKRLAAVLAKRTPGPLSAHQTISGTFQLLSEHGGILGETTHHGKMMYDAVAWAAAVNTIDALVKVAQNGRRVLASQVVQQAPYASYSEALSDFEQALTDLDACIAAALGDGNE